MNVHAKKIAVLGLARSGESAARFLASRGAQVTLLDSGSSEAVQKKAAIISAELRVVTGSAALDFRESFDLIVLSPGIGPSAELVRQFSQRGIQLTGEIEMAFAFCKTPVIAITGTNGKTTTTELIETMLNSVGMSTMACGNIGLPFSEVMGRADLSLDFITLEVSSFQLETISSFHPKIALWLNLTLDHLDRYSGMEEYRAAKLRIFENQTADDFAVINACNELPVLLAKKITFSAYSQNADFTLGDGVICYKGVHLASLSSFHLRGLHNVENLMASLGVAVAAGLPFYKVLPALQNYMPSPHRCQLIATIGGVNFINDSKATNIDALAKALASQTGPVILIAGGKDKGFSFENLAQTVAVKVKMAVLIGEMAGRIQQSWRHSVDCRLATSLLNAVEIAYASAAPGDTVLFSPGTSSFDMFRDYADRGHQFCQSVHLLVNKIPVQQS